MPNLGFRPGIYSNPVYPVWEGFLSFLNHGARLYTNTRDGVATIGWLVSSLPVGYALRSYRQRFLTTNVPTGQPVIIPMPDSNGMPSPLEQDEDGNYYPHDEPGEEVPDATNNIEPGVDISLNPLKIVLRGIFLPIFGAIDIGIASAKPIVYTFVSLIYHSLPLTNPTRLRRFARVYVREKTWKHWQDVPSFATCFNCKFPANRANRAEACKFGQGRHQPCTNYSSRLALDRLLQNMSNRYKINLDLGSKTDASVIQNPVLDSEQTIDRFRRVARVLASKGCIHSIDTPDFEPSYLVPEGTPDGLGWQKPEARWRYQDRAFGLRCVRCYPRTLHNWNPSAIAVLRQNPPYGWYARMTSIEKIDVAVISAIVFQLKLWCQTELQAGYHYFVSALSYNRLDKYSHDITQEERIFIVDCVETKVELCQKYPQLIAVGTKWLVLPQINGPFSLATWRLVLMGVNPVECWIHSVNQSFIGYQPQSAMLLKRTKANWSSLEIGSIWPFFMGNALVFGGTCAVLPSEFAIYMYVLGHCYGIDELIPMATQDLTVLIVDGPGLPRPLAPIIPIGKYAAIDVTFKVVTTNRREGITITCPFNREYLWMVAAISRRSVDDGRIGLWHAFSDPRAFDVTQVHGDYLEGEWTQIDPFAMRFEQLAIAGENVLAELTTSMGGITFFTFGSRGDRNPVTALARCLAVLGSRVTVIHLNTLDEAPALIDIADSATAHRVSIYNRARTYVGGFQSSFLIVPANLHYPEHLSYSLAPPDDIIFPMVASENALINTINSLLGLVISPDFYIGGYQRPFYLPTSADGHKFHEFRLNTGTDKDIGAWWGGKGSIPDEAKDIPLIAPGDHQEEFAKYSTIYCHGGAGTVSLIAACGAKAITLGNGLDQSYREPSDAGAGSSPGAPWDNVFLALGTYRLAFFGIWARTNWYNVPKLLGWLGLGPIAMTMFRSVILYLLYSRLQRGSIVTSDPLATLYLLCFPSRSPSLLQLLLVTFGGKIVERAIYTLGKSYYWVFEWFVYLNLRMARSIVAIWLAQTYGLGYGLLSSLLMRPLTFFAAGMYSWLVENTLGFRNEFHKDHTQVFMELSPRIHHIPVLHAALVIPSLGQRFEGITNEVGMYEFKLTPGSYESAIILPTSLDITDVLEARSPIARYGLAWNCLTGLVRVFSHQLPKLGIGLIPIVGTSVLSALIATAGSVVLAVCYGATVAVPGMIGISFTRHGTLSIFGGMVSDLLDSLALSNPLLAALEWWSGLGIL